MSNILHDRHCELDLQALPVKQSLRRDCFGASLRARVRLAMTIFYHLLLGLLLFCPAAQAGLDGPGSGLVGWWKFDEGGGAIAADSSGNGNTGILVNGPSWVAGVDGGALSFDGTNEYVTVPYNSSLNMTHSDATLAFWYMPELKSSFTVSPFVGKEYSYGQTSYGVDDGAGLNYDNFQGFAVNIMNENGTNFFNSGAEIYPNKWYYYLATFHDTGTGTDVSMYLNGELVRTTQSTLRIEDSGHEFRIGMQGGYFTKGRIDDVRVWNRALTDSDIQTLYSLFSAPSNPTNDLTPPIIGTPYPKGILPANSHYIILSVTTDEVATCKYDTNPNVTYACMANTFSTTLQLEHKQVIKGIEDGRHYTYYVKCQDVQGNSNSQDYAVSFSTAPPTPFQELPSIHSDNYWFVSPSGSANGDGSITNPWDLQTALSQPAGVQPGDTIWLRNGIYGTGNTLFTSTLSGTSDNPIVVRQYPGERAIIDGGLYGSGHGQYTTFWGFEVFTSDGIRLISRFSEENKHVGISLEGPNLKLINMIIHDLHTDGIGDWGDADEIYGAIMWGIGMYDYNYAGATIWNPILSGPGIYAQNRNGIKYIRDIISFKEYTSGFKAYAEQGYADGFDIEGNVNFNNGRWNMLVASWTNPIHGLVLKDNYLYLDASETNYGDKYGLEIGYFDTDMINAILQDNYIVGGGYLPALMIHKWQTLNVVGNTVVSLPPWTPIMAAEAPVVQLDQSTAPRSYTWDNNSYFSSSASVLSLFKVDNLDKILAQVRSELGIDAHSSYSTSLPTQNVIVVRPNLYEPGERGNIIVYNWENKSFVDVDISSIGFVKGDYFEVYDVQNLFGQAVYSGIYNGGTIRLPMNLTDTQPMLGTTVHMKLGHTDSLFNAFLIKKAVHYWAISDVSADGHVTAYDAALTAQDAVGLITFTPAQVQAGDVDGNSQITAYDAALIAQRAVGLITKFPVEG